MTIVATNYNFTFVNTTFFNKPSIKKVDCCNIPYKNGDMSWGFYNCQNLVEVTNINQNVTSLYQTFNYCYNLTNVPNIPSGVTNMGGTFERCRKLTNIPTIPSSVNTMSWCFEGCASITTSPTIPSNVTSLKGTYWGCSNLSEAPTIPSNVTDMGNTFYGCSNLVTAPTIPSSVTDMGGTFEGCVNILGSVFVSGTEVTNATNCFGDTNLTKLVYIPFIYDNSVLTKTYNSFIAAGYDELGTKDKVYLVDSSGATKYLNVTDYTYEKYVNRIVSLTGYIGPGGNVSVPELEDEE